MTIKTVARASARLSEQTLLDMLWIMLLSRRLDERAWALHRQGKIHFHISGMGHEAAQVGAAFAIHRGVDYVHLYYRSNGQWRVPEEEYSCPKRRNLFQFLRSWL